MFIFGAGTLIATPTLDATGSTIANPTPVRLGTLHDVQGGFKFEAKKLYGAQQFPVAIGRGKGSMDFTAKMADINAAVLGSLLFGQNPATGIRAASLDNPGTVPAGGGTLTPTAPNSGTVVADLGVAYVATGQPLTRVAALTKAGQYTFNAATGVYTFYSADANAAVLISYEYTSGTVGQSFTISNQMMGQSPFFSVMLIEQYQGKTLALKLNACTSHDLSLPFKSEDFAVSDFKFEAMADGAGNIGTASLF